MTICGPATRALTEVPEMVRRVAEALYGRAIARAVERGFSGENLVPFSAQSRESQNSYYDSARAAIEEMRVPTDSMKTLDANSWIIGTDEIPPARVEIGLSIWTVMINEALK